MDNPISRTSPSVAMSLEPRTFYPGRILPLPSPYENPLLPSLATMVMRPLTTPRFRSQAPEGFLSSTSGLPQTTSNLGSQRQQTRAHFPGKSHPSDVPNPRLKPPTQPPSTTCQPKPSVDGFEFIQINKSSGKTDSAGGASMRSHIMRRFHENRRQRGKAKVCLSVLPAPHRCSTIRSSITSVQSLEVASNRHRLPSVSDQPFRSTIRGQSFNMPSKEILPQTINVEAFCVQCGKLILQQTPDDAWTLYGRLSRVPLSMLGSDAHDPFDSLAIPISHKMHGLIHHFIHSVIFPLNPPIYQGDGLRDLVSIVQIALALSDAVCVRALVAAGASHRSAFKSNVVSPLDWKRREEVKQDLDDAHYHMAEGVRLLNERFADPKQALMPSSLLGAALLAMCPSYLGDVKLVENHYQGILKMIELRGGIDTLPRAIANQMLRMSTNMAWKKREKAKLPMYNSRFRENGTQVSAVDVCNKSATDLFPGNQHYVALKPASSPFRNNRFETFLWGELFAVACDLHRLSYIIDLNARHPRRLGSVQREFFEDTYAAALHALVSFSYPDDVGVMKTAAYYRQHAWRVAGIIYLYTGIREWDAPMHPIKAMISEFIFSLQASDLSSIWSSTPEVLLWMLFVGACGTWDRTDRGWLLHELKYGIRLLGIEGPVQLEEMLKSMLFVNSMRARYLNIIWQELNT